MASEGTQPTILIVDDEPINIKVLSDLLKDDAQIIFATDGEKGIASVHENHPALILLDVMMPDLDGYEVCKRLKANPRTKSIPIIFITAMDHEQDVAAGLELGAIDYVTKPFNPDVVRMKVKNQLAHASSSVIAISDKSAPTTDPSDPQAKRSIGRGPVFALLAVSIIAAGIAGYWYLDGPGVDRITGGSSMSRNTPAPETGETGASTVRRADLSWVKTSKCAQPPQVAWWLNKTRQKIAGYAHTTYGGDWNSYINKWIQRRTKLEDISQRGSIAVTTSGVRLSGADLKAYIVQTTQRINVMRCLAEENAISRK